MKKAKSLEEILCLIDDAYTDSAYIRSGEFLDSKLVQHKALDFDHQSFIMWSEVRRN